MARQAEREPVPYLAPVSSRTEDHDDAGSRREDDEQDGQGDAEEPSGPQALEDRRDVTSADDATIEKALAAASRSAEAGELDPATVEQARFLEEHPETAPGDQRSTSEVLEPRVISRAPSSPWDDGLGRTALRCAQTLLVVIVAVGLIYAAVQLRTVVIPLLLAALIASAASPLVAFLTRHRFTRGPATAVVMLTGLVVLGGLGYAVFAAVRGQWDQLARSANEGLDRLGTFITDGPFNITDAQLQEVRETAVNVVTGQQFRDSAISGLSTAASVATGLALGVVVLFYFLKDGPRIWAFFISATEGPAHARLAHVGTNATGVLGGYIRGTAAVASVDAIFIGVGIAVLGVPLALPLALITFVGAFIPIVGAVAAGILAALVALVTNGLTTALIVVAIIIVVQQVESNLLQPLLLGKALSLHPLAILVALTAGTILAGIIGALISVPIAAVLWSAVTTWNADKRTTRARIAEVTSSEG